MVALIVVLTAVVGLLVVLVAGLLRSHADILRALHSLGAGVGDPLADPAGPGAVPVDLGRSQAGHPGQASHPGHAGHGPTDRGPITMGPPLPAERSSTTAPTVAGLTPTGDALAVSVGTTGGLTLLAFLSSGCASCQGFWQAFASGGSALLPGVALLAVTKGPEREVPAEVATRSGGATVIMSSEAWTDYEVPGSPFFVLVDGARGRRIGEGIANTFAQVAELVRRAQLERGDGPIDPSFPGNGPSGEGSPADGPEGREPFGTGGSGPERERANDQALRAAGILPGDRSLYPSTLEDLYGPAGQGGRQAS